MYLRSTAPVQHASAQNWKFSTTSFGTLGGQERTHLEILKKTCVYTVVHHVKDMESAHLLSVAASPIKKDEVCVQHGRRDPLERAVAIVSLGRGILWAHMSIFMCNIHVGEYVSHLGHAE